MMSYFKHREKANVRTTGAKGRGGTLLALCLLLQGTQQIQ